MGHTLYSGVTQTYQLGDSIPFQYTMNQAQVTASGLNYPYNGQGFVKDLVSLEARGIISSNLPVTQTIDPHFPDPYSLQWMVGIQQVLPWGMSLDLSYNGNRGLHEQFNEVRNKPNRITGVAPSPTFGGVPYIAVDDRSKYSGLQATLRKRLQRGLMFSSSLTYSSGYAFGDGDNLLQIAPQDPYNFHAEWGPTPYNIRARSVTNVIWDIPFSRWLGTSNGLAKAALDGWQISGVFTGQTGSPVNIVNSASANATDRPDAADNGISPYVSGYETGVHQYLNIQAFTQVPISSLSGLQTRPGNLMRNALRSPGFENLDLSLAKTFVIKERFRFQVRADTFNTLNHTNLGGLVTAINNSTFGRLTSATARSMQLAARVRF